METGFPLAPKQEIFYPIRLTIAKKYFIFAGKGDFPMSKARSPNYPAISLPDAIGRVKVIHAKAHTHKVDALTMAQAAGYAGINGASLSLLSALKKFGLLDEFGKELKVSHNALSIIADPVTSEIRQVAIQRCAFAPVLFTKIRNQFPDSVPSDEIVRSYLIKNSFSSSTVDVAIRAFRETMKLVTDEGLGYTSRVNEVDVDAIMKGLDQLPEVPQKTEPERAITGTPKIIPIVSTEIGAYPVAKNCTIRLLASGAYTRKSIEALVKQLQLNLELDVFPHEEPI